MEKIKSKPVVLTGGHFSPSYCVTLALIRQGIPVVYFGRASAFEDRKDKSLEQDIIAALPQVSFISLNAPRLNSLLQLPLLLSSVYTVLVALLKNRPQYVLTFGGYVSFPVSFVAWLLHIPIYLHEQTIAPGEANIRLALVASKVFVSFPETVENFPNGKVICTGNPLLERYQNETKPKWFDKLTNKPILLVLGGSSGSHSLNNLIAPLLTELSMRYSVVHQIGDSSYQDFDALSKLKSDSYIPMKFIQPTDLSFLLQRAHIVLTRAGANTFFDLVYYQKPSILVPLPWSAFNEQERQAQVLKLNGVAEIFAQNRNPLELLSIIEEVEINYHHYVRHFTNLTPIRKQIISGEKLLSYIQSR